MVSRVGSLPWGTMGGFLPSGLRFSARSAPLVLSRFPECKTCQMVPCETLATGLLFLLRQLIYSLGQETFANKEKTVTASPRHWQFESWNHYEGAWQTNFFFNGSIGYCYLKEQLNGYLGTILFVPLKHPRFCLFNMLGIFFSQFKLKNHRDYRQH